MFALLQLSRPRRPFSATVPATIAMLMRVSTQRQKRTPQVFQTGAHRPPPSVHRPALLITNTARQPARRREGHTKRRCLPNSSPPAEANQRPAGSDRTPRHGRQKAEPRGTQFSVRARIQRAAEKCDSVQKDRRQETTGPPYAQEPRHAGNHAQV